jgi:hypothetical protein
MELVNAIVRDHFWTLISPAWFLVLAAITGLAAWRRNIILRLATVVCIIVTTMHREGLFGVFVRAALGYADSHGGVADGFRNGLRGMLAYAQATELYPIGSAVLLGILSFVPAERARIKKHSSPTSVIQGPSG